MDSIRVALHVVAELLAWPVMLGLLGLAAAMLTALGGFSAELLQRLRHRRRALEAGLARLAEPGRGDEPEDLRLEWVLQEEESRRWAEVSRLRLAVRAGPALGLMGTLIPMASALQGLADGDLPVLASQLVTAFAATVVGLAASLVAYLVAAVRERWVRADLRVLAFEAERRSRAAAGH